MPKTAEQHRAERKELEELETRLDNLENILAREEIDDLKVQIAKLEKSTDRRFR